MATPIKLKRYSTNDGMAAIDIGSQPDTGNLLVRATYLIGMSKKTSKWYQRLSDTGMPLPYRSELETRIIEDPDYNFEGLLRDA